MQYYEGVGRRKTSTARVRIATGTGKFLVNDKPVQAFFTRPGDQDIILTPLRTAGMEGKLDISVRVQGGGVTGQAGAVRHGLARALLTLSPELRGALRAGGHLTRDSREKERKKYGRRGARRSFQFSKR